MSLEPALPPLGFVQCTSPAVLNKPVHISVKSCVSLQETETAVAILNRKGLILELKKIFFRKGWRSNRLLTESPRNAILIPQY